MRDDGDDEKRPKLFWIRVGLGNLGKAETGRGAAEEPFGAPACGSAERGNEE
jgi:hypothetical protein